MPIQTAAAALTGAPRARFSAGPRIRLGAVVAGLALFAISGLGALALERMGASLHGEVPRGWPANGCLGASVAPLGHQIVAGQGSLCIAADGTHGTLDIAHLTPTEPYREWIAYFEWPGLCSFASLIYQIRHFDQPCTMADLEGPQPHGLVRLVAESAVDSQGVLHIDGLIPELTLKQRSQAWLLVGQPAWSPLSHDSNGLDHSDSVPPLARAVFNVP